MENKIYHFRSKKRTMKCTIETDVFIDINFYNKTGKPVREDIVMYCTSPVVEEMEVLRLRENHYGR